MGMDHLTKMRLVGRNKMTTMTVTAMFISALLMSVITLFLRAFPALVPLKWLDSPILRALNFALPISVMMILILNSLAIPESSMTDIFAKVGAMFLVLGSYLWWKNVFVSVIVGVASLNGILYLVALFA